VSHLRRSDPPTPKQVEAFQLLVIHRGNFTATGRALGIRDTGVHDAVRAFLGRADTQARREALG
jgi:hypothetical protein